MSKLFWKSAISISEACRSVKPGLLATLYELRAVPELIRHIAASERSLVRSLPRGDGRPVLVIPGWWVERKGKGQVKVFSGKEVAANLPANGKPAALSAEKIQRLGDRIEAHCRNVEGA